MRRSFWAGCCTAGVVFFMAASASAASSPKKGVGTWSFNGGAQALAAVNASWFYTWGPGTGGISAPGVTFVPMIWGSSDVTTANLNRVKTEGPVLLGFNEPDNGSQANLSAQQALSLWPQLVATGLRLGSPAPASNAQVSGGWLDTFMKGAAQQGLRVDFICLHWYGGHFDTSTAVSELKTYIDQTHSKYNLPIWLTEYALTNYSGGPMYPTAAEQAAFATASVAMLEATPYVERYAWFSLPPCAAGGGNGGCGSGNTTPLASNGGSLTSVGVAYSAAGGSSAAQPDAGSPTAQVMDAGSGDTGAYSEDASLLSDDGGFSVTDGGPMSRGGHSSDSGGATTPARAADSGPVANDDAGASSGDLPSSPKGSCQCELGRHGSGQNGTAALLAGLVAVSLRTARRRAKRASP